MSTWFWELEHLEPRYLMSGATAIVGGTIVGAPSTLNIQGTLTQSCLTLSGQIVSNNAATLVQTNDASAAQDVAEDIPSLDISVQITAIQANGSKNVSTAISVLNYSSVAEVGTVNFTIYASASGQLDGSQILVQSINQDVNVANDGQTPENFNESFALPSTLPAGNYYLIVQATPAGSADVDPADNVAASDHEIAVGAHGAATLLRNVDVSVTVNDVERGDGLNCTISLSLYNYSDSPDIGKVNFTVYASTDGQVDDQAVQVATFSCDQNIENDGQTSIDFQEKVTLPSNLAPGDYYLVVEANPVGAVDIDPSDNVSCSQSPVIVNGKDIGVQLTNVQLGDNGQISSTISVYNYSDFADVGHVKFSVYLSASGQVDSQAIPVATFVQDVNVANDGQTSDDIQKTFTMPTGLGLGDYYLVVQADPIGAADVDPSDNVACSDTTVHAPGTGKDIGVYFSNDQFGNNGQLTSTISVYNNGSSAQVGMVKFTIYLSASGQVDDQAVFVKTFTRDVNAANDGQATYDIPVNFALPAGLAAGDYYLVVQADPVGGGDDNPVDNIACSQSSLNIHGTDIGVYLTNLQAAGPGQVSATLRVYNNGDFPEVGLVKFNFYLSISGKVDSQAILVKSDTQNVNVANDDVTTDDIQEDVSLPADLAPGDYYLVVEADPVGPTDINPWNNVARSDAVIIHGRDVAVDISSLQVGGNGQVSTTISVYNNGDSPEVGMVKFTIYLSASGQVDDQAVPVASFTQDVNVANDGQTAWQTFQMQSSEDISQTFSLPAGLAAGNYYLVVQAQTLDGSDANPSDNVSPSYDVLTVGQDGSVAILPRVNLNFQVHNVQIGDGSAISATVNLQNNSSVADVGQVNFEIAAIPTSLVYSVQPIPIASFSQDVNSANDWMTTEDIQENFTWPAGLAAGDYYLVVLASPGGPNAASIPSNFSYSGVSSVVLAFGQDGSVSIAPPPAYVPGWGPVNFDSIYWYSQHVDGGNTPFTVIDPVECGPFIQGPPRHLNVPSAPGGPTSENTPGVALNYSSKKMSIAPTLAASGTVGAAVDSSTPVISILAGAAVQTNFQSPAATPVTPEPTPAYDSPSATASGGVVDLLASASSDNADAGTSTFYHANHTASHTPIHKGA